MQIDPEEFRRHYEMLSDEALLELNRDELVDEARTYYDAELAERNLAPQGTQQDPEHAGTETEDHPEEGLQLVASFLSLDEANFARGLLLSADVPSSFENEQGGPWKGTGELRLTVSAAVYDHACEILEAEISEEDLIAQAEAAEPESSDAAADDEPS